MEFLDIVQKIVEVIKKYVPADTEIFLFGSWAKGNAVSTSDVDIGILGKEPLPLVTMAHIKEEVESIPTLRSIDVVDLRASDERFRHYALTNSKKIL